MQNVTPCKRRHALAKIPSGQQRTCWPLTCLSLWRVEQRGSQRFSCLASKLSK